MTKREKVKTIKGLICGYLLPEDISPVEFEVWLQDSDLGLFRHFRTGELVDNEELERREHLNHHKKVIRLIFVDGKTIL